MMIQETNECVVCGDTMTFSFTETSVVGNKSMTRTATITVPSDSDAERVMRVLKRAVSEGDVTTS